MLTAPGLYDILFGVTAEDLTAARSKKYIRVLNLLEMGFTIPEIREKVRLRDEEKWEAFCRTGRLLRIFANTGPLAAHSRFTFADLESSNVHRGHFPSDQKPRKTTLEVLSRNGDSDSENDSATERKRSENGAKTESSHAGAQNQYIYTSPSPSINPSTNPEQETRATNAADSLSGSERAAGEELPPLALPPDLQPIYADKEGWKTKEIAIAIQRLTDEQKRTGKIVNGQGRLKYLRKVLCGVRADLSTTQHMEMLVAQEGGKRDTPQPLTPEEKAPIDRTLQDLADIELKEIQKMRAAGFNPGGLT